MTAGRSLGATLPHSSILYSTYSPYVCEWNCIYVRTFLSLIITSSVNPTSKTRTSGPGVVVPRGLCMIMLLAHVPASSGLQMPRMGAVPLAPPEIAALNIGEAVTVPRPDRRALTLRRVAWRPHAFLVRNLLTDDECAELISASATEMRPAATAGRTSGRRKCDICRLAPSQEPLLRQLTTEVRQLLLSKDMRRETSADEELHVLRYAPGGEARSGARTAPCV